MATERHAQRPEQRLVVALRHEASCRPRNRACGQVLKTFSRHDREQRHHSQRRQEGQHQNEPASAATTATPSMRPAASCRRSRDQMGVVSRIPAEAHMVAARAVIDGPRAASRRSGPVAVRGLDLVMDARAQRVIRRATMPRTVKIGRVAPAARKRTNSGRTISKARARVPAMHAELRRLAVRMDIDAVAVAGRPMQCRSTSKRFTSPMNSATKRADRAGRRSRRRSRSARTGPLA